MVLGDIPIIYLVVGVAIFLIIGIVFFYFAVLKKKGKKGDVEKPAKDSKGNKNKTAAEKEIEAAKINPTEKPLFQIKESIAPPQIPDLKNATGFDVRYPLIEPYVYARVKWEASSNELVYSVEEPELSDREKEILNTLEKGIGELINLSHISTNTKETLILYLEKNIRVLLTELSIKITKQTFLKIMYYIYRDFVGMNKIEPLMNDYFIEDVECNGVNAPIYIVHRKYRNIRTNVVYDDINVMASFVEKLAQKCGKYVSYAEPILDGALPDGSRVNATYSKDVTSRGPTFTIRKFTKEPWSPIQLVQKDTVSAEILAYAWLCIEYGHSFMVIGGTGSGKTSLLNALAFFFPPQARVVTIEDTRELTLEHENWLPSVARAGVGLGNILGQKHGEVSLFDLLRASFRQRPDYIVVGEIRGKEAYVLFQAFASGHPGCATMHAENVETMIRRLETNPINLSGSLVMTLSTVFVMEQTKVRGKNVRKVSNVTEIIDVKENLGGQTVNSVFDWDPSNLKFAMNPRSKVFEEIAVHYGYPLASVQKEFNYRVQLLEKLLATGVVGFKEVQSIIQQYYKAPGMVLKKYGVI